MKYILYILLTCVICLSCKDKYSYYIQKELVVMPSGHVYINSRIDSVKTGVKLKLNTTNPTDNFYDVINGLQWDKHVKRCSIRYNNYLKPEFINQ